ncbi:MAG: hypothetical protein ACYCQJ_01915 [Nitrososphaerales archaeon]
MYKCRSFLETTFGSIESWQRINVRDSDLICPQAVRDLDRVGPSDTSPEYYTAMGILFGNLSEPIIS